MIRSIVETMDEENPIGIEKKKCIDQSFGPVRDMFRLHVALSLLFFKLKWKVNRFDMFVNVVGMCVCLWEKERKRERECCDRSIHVDIKISVVFEMSKRLGWNSMRNSSSRRFSFLNDSIFFLIIFHRTKNKFRQTYRH